uniref:Uncharacterized protein n=1 Tax=Sphaerodactylus townsendi TaxID=933632 RepID=A0ACB8FHH4_9SAUR
MDRVVYQNVTTVDHGLPDYKLTSARWLALKFNLSTVGSKFITSGTINSTASGAPQGQVTRNLELLNEQAEKDNQYLQFRVLASRIHDWLDRMLVEQFQVALNPEIREWMMLNVTPRNLQEWIDIARDVATRMQNFKALDGRATVEQWSTPHAKKAAHETSSRPH